MKCSSKPRLYQKLMITVTLATALSGAVFCAMGERQEDNKAVLLVSEMEIALLQCRRAEKNFLLRHDRASANRFSQGFLTLRKHEASMRSVTEDRAILALLDDIHAEIAIYENALQDIAGLYDTATFGPVRDPALSKITDEVTLMTEPTVTPSSVNETRSLIEAARNLEYYIQVLPRSSAGLIITLNLRRWEKNLQESYDKSGSGTDSKGIACRRKTTREVLELRDFIDANGSKANGAQMETARAALRQYELNFKQLVANQDASHMKKKALTGSARKVENKIQMIKGCLTLDTDQTPIIAYQMEICLLQCRRAEKNFLLRHDRASADSFVRRVQALRKHETRMRSVSGDRAILSLLDDIGEETKAYKTAFQDIMGLYDPVTFGPVSDPALSKISGEVTLLAEPKATPSCADSTRSVIEAARNLEYYINICAENSTPLVSILQARRWEKNFHKRHDTLTGGINSTSMLYMRKIEQETSKIRDWLQSQKTKGRPKAELARIESALHRYELNVSELSRNVDGFYIKKKELVRAARNLDRLVQMVQQKALKTETETEVGGIYYLSPKLPIHGQPEGNHHDVGSLLSNQPSTHGYRHCKNWMQFYFDHDGQYTEANLISSIYFHIWIRTVNNSIDLGYQKDGKYSGGPGGMDDLIAIEYDDSKGYSTKNGCSLITGKMDMNCLFQGEEIYKFAIKLSRHSSYPSVVMEPNQYSFIIVNPPCDSVLKATDSDSDGLNDYEEMFVYYSNPHDEDTDGDGFCDRTEVAKGTSPHVNDLYSGRIIDGITDTPHIEHHKDIDGDWIVEKKETHVNTKITLHGNLVVRNGGCLTLVNSILDMNGKEKNKHIHVGKDSALNLRKSKINLNETGYWYKIVEGGKVEIDSDLDIYGTLIVQESMLQNGLGMKVRQGSMTRIHDSLILNSYHISYEGASDSEIRRSIVSTFIGIPIYCKLSSPIIRDSLLSVEYGGVGIYCFGSSPSIDNSKIFVCEDEDSESSSFILVANSRPVLSGTHFNAKRVSRDETSSMVFE